MAAYCSKCTDHRIHLWSGSANPRGCSDGSVDTRPDRYIVWALDVERAFDKEMVLTRYLLKPLYKEEEIGKKVKANTLRGEMKT